MADIQLVLQPVTNATGRIIVPNSDIGDLSQVRVTLLRVQPGIATSSAITDVNGHFTIPAISPGRYYLHTNLGTSELARGAGWSVDRVDANGRQVADGAIDVSSGMQLNLTIAMADGRTQLSGVVQKDDRPIGGYYVVAFPSEPEGRVLGSLRFPLPVRAATNGTFDLSGLPLGSYHVAALASVDTC